MQNYQIGSGGVVEALIHKGEDRLLTDLFVDLVGVNQAPPQSGRAADQHLEGEVA